jgi:hypothetical protein
MDIFLSWWRIIFNKCPFLFILSLFKGFQLKVNLLIFQLLWPRPSHLPLLPVSPLSTLVACMVFFLPGEQLSSEHLFLLALHSLVASPFRRLVFPRPLPPSPFRRERDTTRPASIPSSPPSVRVRATPVPPSALLATIGSR